MNESTMARRPRLEQSLILPNIAAYVGYRDVFGQDMTSARMVETLQSIGLERLLPILGGINATALGLSEPNAGLERRLASLFMSSQTVSELETRGWPEARNASTVFHRSAVLVLAKYALAHCPDKGKLIAPDAGLGELFLAANDLLTRNSAPMPEGVDYLAFASALLPVADLAGGPEVLARAGRARGIWSACTDPPRSKPTKEWATTFEQTYGISIADFIRAVYLMLAHFSAFDPKEADCSKNMWIHPEVSLANSTFPLHTFRRALDALSDGPQEFAAQLRGKLDGSWILDTSVLRRKPLIKLNDTTYFCLDLGFLSEALVDGIYWMLDSCLPSKPKAALRERFGPEFARYLHAILDRAIGPKSPLLAVRHGRLQFVSSGECADAYIDCGSELVLFEFKGSLLRPMAKYSGLRQALEDDMTAKFTGKGLAKPDDRKGVTQMAWSIKKLLEGEPVTVPGFDIRQVKRIIPVLVCYDPAMSCPQIPEYLEEVFRASLNWLKVEAGKVGRLSVLTTREFEALERLSRNMSVAHVLQEFHARSSSFTSFWDFAAVAYADDMNPDGTYVGDQMKLLHDDVLSTFPGG